MFAAYMMSLKVKCRDRQLHDNVAVVTTEELPLGYTTTFM